LEHDVLNRDLEEVDKYAPHKCCCTFNDKITYVVIQSNDHIRATSTMPNFLQGELIEGKIHLA